MSKNKKTLYKQCLLQRKNERQMSFIPEEFAEMWAFVGLKEEKGWEEGWQVVEVFEPAVSESDVITAQQQSRNTRKASDI
jgi:hypothetical protein